METGQHPPQAVPLEVIEVPNSSFMSDQPTNAVIAGTEEIFIIDPGSERGVELIPEALARRGAVRVKAIVLTHGHPDHAIAARPLKELYHCPVMLNPKEEPILRQFLSWSDIDLPLTGGMTLTIEGGSFETVDTPGHSPGHVALFDPVSRTLIAGDLVSGHGTVGIFPPYGKMTEYFDSLRHAETLGACTVIPGHGPTLTDPAGLFQQYITRRTSREEQIYDVVAEEPTTIPTIVARLYTDIVPQFRRAAEATVLAHLEKLEGEGRVKRLADDRWQGRR